MKVKFIAFSVAATSIITLEQLFSHIKLYEQMIEEEKNDKK
jgi:hypothetical protein